MMPSLDFLAIPLLTASGLVLLSLLAGLFSARLGFSFLLVFLVAGMLLGEDGPGGVVFNDFRLGFWVGNVALAVILLDGGLRTHHSTFRTGLRPALWLATLGVLLCAGLTGIAAHWLFGLAWPLALLLGAIVGSTDAAAVFSLLKSSGVRLNERVAATLEIESGMNDPMAVYLTLALIAWVVPGQGVAADWRDTLLSLFAQFGWGTVLGVACGFGFAELLKRLAPWLEAGGGAHALMVLCTGLCVFALATWLGGSGFLAVYVFGVVVANRAPKGITPTLSAMDGFAWLAQAGMFLLLGLLVTPTEVLRTLVPALVLSALLMVVARPLAVWLCLKPQRFSNREIAFISWVGLRGAVPVVLAVFPLMAGVEGAKVFFNVAFVVVLTSLLLQGSTIAWSARRTRVALPDGNDTTQSRAVFGDFEVPGNAPMKDLCSFYSLPTPPLPSGITVASWLQDALHRPAVVGDQARLGQADFCVRELVDGQITRVGIKLAHSELH
jgi:cell volume regulation protein A